MLQKPTVNPTINARKVRSIAGGGGNKIVAVENLFTGLRRCHISLDFRISSFLPLVTFFTLLPFIFYQELRYALINLVLTVFRETTIQYNTVVGDYINIIQW